MKKRNYSILLGLLCLTVFMLTSNDALAGGIFDGLAQKTGNFAQGLRKLAYAISGFGIIMFTFLAICGKINFKHLGYIIISLFFLSGVGELIHYVSGSTPEIVFKADTYEAAGRSVGNISAHRSSL